MTMKVIGLDIAKHAAWYEKHSTHCTAVLSAKGRE